MQYPFEVRCISAFSLMYSSFLFTALYGVTTSHSGQIDLSISACNPIVKSQEELDRLTQIYFIQELDSIAAMCGLNGKAVTAKCDESLHTDQYLGKQNLLQIEVR